MVGVGLDRFSTPDPNDSGMLDVVGFDTATPQLISDFRPRRPLRARALRAPFETEEAEMHLHLVRVAARPKQVSRPAKVVLLEARRKARLEAARPERPHPRPAA